MTARRVMTAAFAMGLAGLGTAAAQTGARTDAVEILREMIAIRSTEYQVDETRRLLDRVEARLLAAGFAAADIEKIDSEAGAPNLIATYRGGGDRAPLLTMAHVDVVDAEPDDWSVAPYTLAEVDGYFYGRGTNDNKAGAAMLVANFVRLRQEGFVPDRDLVMILTGDEESAMTGIRHLVAHVPRLLEAEFALNTDAGSGALDPNGEPQAFYVQTSEKLYQDFELEATNAGGHSSRPRADNAIYELARALARIEAHRFPIELNDGTRAWMERSAVFQDPASADLMRAVAGESLDYAAAAQLAARSPLANATLRTTCTATMLNGGHAVNALPRSARAIINCRILPGHGADEIHATLRELAGVGITVTPLAQSDPSPPSPWDDERMAPVEQIVAELWPGTPVIPNMSTGATDALAVRNAGVPVYGISAIFDDPEDARAHGLDERIGVQAFHDSVEFWYRMLRRFSGARP